MEVAAGLIKLNPDSNSKAIDKYHYELMASITAPNGNIVAKPLLDLKV